MRHKLPGLGLGIILLLFLLPSSSVSAATFSYSYMFFSVTVNSWQVSDNPLGATVQGSAQQSLPFTIRILSVTGQAMDQDEVVLGSGQIVNLPVDMAPNNQVALTAALSSVYSTSQLESMNIQNVHVTVTASFCLPSWLGCVGPFQETWQHTYTAADLDQLATQLHG